MNKKDRDTLLFANYALTETKKYIDNYMQKIALALEKNISSQDVDELVDDLDESITHEIEDHLDVLAEKLQKHLCYRSVD